MFEPTLPRPADVRQNAQEVLELHQAAVDFRREAEHRQAFEDYCQWYYRIAAQNQAELKAMTAQDDSAFMGWLWR